VEFYATVPHGKRVQLLKTVEEATGVDLEEWGPNLYEFKDLVAVEHLLRVAAGLDSMVVGEPQILGQVAEAYTQSLRVGSAGPVLSKLLRTAIHAGKRARHETSISRNPASISSLAVAKVEAELTRLAGARVLVIGAGEMAELTVEALKKRGAEHIAVLNRTRSRARELARRWQAAAHPLEALEDQIKQADVVLTSTGAPHTILHADLLREAVRDRRGRPIVVVDIAVPRDVDPAAREIPGIKLFDIDQLDSELEDGIAQRQAAIPHVERIVQEELEAFEAWLASLSVVPIIKALHQRAEQVRRDQVEVALRKLPQLGEAEREQLELCTRSLVKKLLHAPTAYLKEQARLGEETDSALLTRELFDLETEPTEDADRTSPGGGV
jgi:glutamyl-tRNA reductase